jgi:formylglycine-generating enzyme required for sulfatase activity
LYRTDPDGGIHGAVDWILRQRWGRANALDAINRALASKTLPIGHNWYVNGHGQCYTIVKGPVDFFMGSSEKSDPDRFINEIPHTRRISRSFAISTREVTATEYARFLDTKPPGIEDVRLDDQFKRFIRSPDSAAGSIIWYEAARYCNWPSQQEGIPKDQWCYPDDIGPGMKLPGDFLKRTGYRLPTEAEWEYACRAGSGSSRPFGHGLGRISEYCWNEKNGGREMHPVGLLKPNDLGLFDILGNAVEFCNDPLLPYAAPPAGQPLEDTMVEGEFSEKITRLIRGGIFLFPSHLMRSAARIGEQPSSRDTVVSFRPARTMP